MKMNDCLVVVFFKNRLKEEVFNINTRHKYNIYMSHILYIFIPHHIEDVRGFQNKVLGFFSENFVSQKLSQS